jgi:uncharacterized damage-inducible protein DinB
MKLAVALVLSLAALVVAVPVAAQGTAGSAANPISEVIRDGWNTARRNLLASATLMPENRFAYRPVETVRTYGQLLAHVAGANYVFCAAARGEKPPFAEDAFEKSATTRAAIIKALEDSLVYCDAAYAKLTDRTAAEIVDGPFGSGKSARAAALLGNTGHLQEHYGNLVTYLRMNNLVPPSSAPSASPGTAR